MHSIVGGGGLTASVASSLLKGQFRIQIWEKSLGVGGRMTTKRSRSGDQSLDLGAQYITANEHYWNTHKEQYENLLSAGILKPLEAKIDNVNEGHNADRHFMAPNGTNSIAKHFFENSECEIKLKTAIKSVRMIEDEKRLKVTSEDGHCDNFDGVLLTMPVPQITQICQPNLLSNFKYELNQVKYSSRFALGLFFGSDVKREHLTGLYPSTAKYIKDDDIFRFVSSDHEKRNPDSKTNDCNSVSVLLHTSVPFGVEHLERSKDEMKPILMDRLQQLFPTWPHPDEVIVHKWRYSQVLEPYPNAPGALVAREDPLLILAGDAFTHSNFNGCLSSAKISASEIVQRF